MDSGQDAIIALHWSLKFTHLQAEVETLRNDIYKYAQFELRERQILIQLALFELVKDRF